MNLSCLVAAPTLIRSDGESYLVRPFTLGDFGFLLRVCGDDLDIDADAGDPMLFSDEAMADWLFGDGLPVLVWTALRRDRPGMSLADAEALAASLDPDTIGRIYRAAMRRDSSALPTEGEGRDLAVLNWNMVAFRYFTDSGILPDAIGALTLDQMHAIHSNGEEGQSARDDENLAAAMAEWEAMHGQGKMEAGSPVTDDQQAALARLQGKTEVTLADLGYVIAPGQEGEKSDE